LGTRRVYKIIKEDASRWMMDYLLDGRIVLGRPVIELTARTKTSVLSSPLLPSPKSKVTSHALTARGLWQRACTYRDVFGGKPF
jgi:hypothetical protein